ncbi:MAG: WYL domain-containing protein [Chloroflexi bacterium]|nr:WYL domain-containing protein [Chloroflexota bacterium]
MRYEGLANIVRLAIRLQGAGGLTLDEIGSEFGVSRRTAERMRDAVEQAFGPLEYEEADDGRRHWRLRSNALRDLIRVSADELVELETAAAEVERAGLHERAVLLRDLAGKLRALVREAERRRIEPDLEALTMAEGLAMRPGPRPRIEPGLLMTLREAIKAGRTVSFRYLSRMTGRRSRQRVQPHGILYGSRAYLVGRSGWTEDMRYWVLANMSEAALSDESFQFDEDFDLEEFAGRSFGVFQEEPIDVVLRFARETAADAATFLFHPGQETEKNDDGSLTVRFTGGGRPRNVLAPVYLGRRGDRRGAREPARADGRIVHPLRGASPSLPRPGRGPSVTQLRPDHGKRRRGKWHTREILTGFAAPTRSSTHSTAAG